MTTTSDSALNARRIKSINNTREMSCNLFSTTSESHIHFMIEKMISLAITISNRKRIEKEMPLYCFTKLKESLQTMTELQFIGYDRDDVIYADAHNHHNHNQPQIAVPNETSTNKDQEILQPVQDRSAISKTSSHKSVHISPKKQTTDDFDNDVGMIITKNTVTHFDDHFLSNPTAHETNQTNQFMFYNTNYDGLNDWSVISQPKPIDIDRDASTTVKTVKGDGTGVESVLTEEDNKREEDKKAVTRFTTTTNSINVGETKRHFFPRANREEKVVKKKRIMIDLPSYDIPKERLFETIEVEDIETLREEVEKEAKQKLMERRMKLKAEQEILEKQKEKAKKQKELEFKNITVDGEGNIIEIKPLVLETFPKEFFNANYNTKEVQVIPAPEPEVKLPQGPIKVEKNPNVMGEVTKTSKGHKEMKVIQNVKDLLHKSKLKNHILNVSQDKNAKGAQNDKEKQPSATNLIEHKKQPILPAGSSFDIFNLECGVTLIEDEKYKTGGRDFFKKYNRYSIENYKRKQGIQMTAIKHKATEKRIKEPITITSNKSNTIVNTITFDNPEPSPVVNTIHLKTKNLRLAINDLDLITEDEEREIAKNFNRTKPNSLFRKANDEMNLEDAHDDMDQFAKTLMGGKEWGNETSPKYKRAARPGVMPNREHVLPKISLTKGRRSRMPVRHTESNFYKKDKDNKHTHKRLSPNKNSYEETDVFAKTMGNTFTVKKPKS